MGFRLEFFEYEVSDFIMGIIVLCFKLFDGVFLLYLFLVDGMLYVIFVISNLCDVSNCVVYSL